jgi:glycosyltransferase involved in cell wall biosynthesis
METTRIERSHAAALSSGQRRIAPGSVRVAYLLSQYPAVSHTFFLQEVAGLRARGLHIETASINPPDRPLDALPAVEAQEARSTMVLKDGRLFATAGKLLATVATNPLALFRGLAAVASVPDLTLRKRAFWLFYLGEALLLGQWMKRRGIRQLHVHFGGAVASVGMLASKAWRLPYSLTIHGPEELLNLDSYHLREKVNAASFVFCISDFCKSQLCQLTDPEQWDKFQVIRLGVDPMMLTPQSRMTSSGITTPPGTRPLELLSIGRLVPAKGHLILLEALKILHQRDLPMNLTIIGGGPDLPALEEFVARSGLTASVTFTSALSHAQTIAQLRRADIFALASFAEGIPVALMEAMSLGLPCVSTPIAGIPELIRSGVDGLLVPPANPLALAEALESLALDSALRKSLGHCSRQRIISQYNLPLNQELLAQSFEERILRSGPKSKERIR